MSTSRNPEVSSHSIEVLQDVTKRVKEVYEILSRETNRVCKEMETQDEKAKTRKQTPSSKIKLNVGGHIFLTTLETLKNAPPDSKLHAMFSGESDPKISEDGSYFIDRDGTHFRYILNYLRTKQPIVPEDKFLRKELLAEAQFYQIKEIINEINEMKVRTLEDSLRLSTEPGVSNR